jgi:penicillin amidase
MQCNRYPRHLLSGILLVMLSSLAAAATVAPETISLPGLRQRVEILKDKWGISHIYAQNESDLFFAQGYNVARDRLLQLELWRRQSTGTVAEVLGKKELQRDTGNRLFMYRGDLTQELNWYHPRGAAIIQSFVNGINAYIEETRRNPPLLTPEFWMLDLKPDNWTPAVVISRFNGLLSNVTQELNMALARFEPVQGDGARLTMPLQRAPEKDASRRAIAIPAQVRADGPSSFIHRSVQVHPPAVHLLI